MAFTLKRENKGTNFRIQSSALFTQLPCPCPRLGTLRTDLSVLLFCYEKLSKVILRAYEFIQTVPGLWFFEFMMAWNDMHLVETTLWTGIWMFPRLARGWCWAAAAQLPGGSHRITRVNHHMLTTPLPPYGHVFTFSTAFNTLHGMVNTLL